MDSINGLTVLALGMGCLQAVLFVIAMLAERPGRR